MPENLKVQGKMNFHLIAPTGTLVDTVADKVLLPASMGDVMILKNRAPSFFFILPGALWIYNKGEKPVCFLVSRGIAEVRRNICSVLAWGVDLDKIDAIKATRDLRSAEKELENLHSESGKKEVLHKIEYLKLLLNGSIHVKQPNFDDKG